MTAAQNHRDFIAIAAGAVLAVIALTTPALAADPDWNQNSGPPRF